MINGFYNSRLVTVRLQQYLQTLSFISAVLWSPVLFAEPVVTYEYTPYEVDLYKSRNLFESIAKKSPIVSDGEIYLGYTHWFVNWSFRWNQKQGMCRVTSVSTTVDITITLPKANRLPKDKKRRAQYTEFSIALLEHELGHTSYPIEAAREIEQSLKAITYAGSCEGLKDKLNQKAHRILERYNQQSKQYDIDTQHGATHGASLN